jgi:hypothetical protein
MIKSSLLQKWLSIALTTCILAAATQAQTTKPAKGELVILKAVYGDLPDGGKADVTEKVKAMVKNNALTVDASNANFGDPAGGVNKSLEVDYKIDDVWYVKTADENETLTIPAKP